MPSTESPVHAGPHPKKKPLKTLIWPPIPTLPKNWKPISMQDDQTTNLKLAQRQSATSCSLNHPISSGSARTITVAAGTNEVAMWALQLYIGLFPNFHSPFREPTVSIFQSVFSHGISILSLHHNSPWVAFHPAPPGRLFFIPRSTMHAHSHTYKIHAHIFNSLQILFTLGIWFSCVQVLDHHTSAKPLQVYT